MPTVDEPIEEGRPDYELLRRAGRSLVPKIYANPVNKQFDMLKAAKKLTLPVVDRTFVFESETDMNTLADFWIHEFRQGGQTLIERCRPAEMELTPLEAELLRAHQQSRTSLFEVIEAHPEEHLVRLRDLIEPDRTEVRLTDVGLSGSLGRAAVLLLLFFRVVTVREFEMTSGFCFTFRPHHKTALLEAYAGRMKRVMPAEWTERKFVFFYRRHREIGEAQIYREALGTA